VLLQANTLPLMTDLVAQGLGYTVLPSCSVVARVQAGDVSASPIEGLRITWTVARPGNRSLNVAAGLMLRTILETVHRLVENGTWSLAKLASDCRAAARK
jgi:LysR family nitrogen assimilation transcriptional regulator